MKDHLISAARVFASTFVVSIAFAITTAGAISWTQDFWFPLAVAAVSAAFKAAINVYLS